jgi:hypothetical protein
MDFGSGSGGGLLRKGGERAMSKMATIDPKLFAPDKINDILCHCIRQAELPQTIGYSRMHHRHYKTGSYERDCDCMACRKERVA